MKFIETKVSNMKNKKFLICIEYLFIVLSIICMKYHYIDIAIIFYILCFMVIMHIDLKCFSILEDIDVYLRSNHINEKKLNIYFTFEYKYFNAFQFLYRAPYFLLSFIMVILFSCDINKFSATICAGFIIGGFIENLIATDCNIQFQLLG